MFYGEVVTKLLDSGADPHIKDEVRKGFVYGMKYISCIWTKSVSL